jgi:5'-nucleotidase
MTIILTNDDGIDAPGMGALLAAVQQMGQWEVIIAAPRDPQSGCGHQVTTGQPIVVQKRSDQAYAIAGTPADCTRIALNQLCPQPKFILSGINAGGNMGSDVYISGTVAAVREAALHRIPGIAISHYRQGKRAFNWEWAAAITARLLTDLIQRPYTPGSFWNINLPHPQPDAPDPQVIFCQPCTQPLPCDFRIEGDKFYYAGEYAKRQRDRDSDVAVCLAGNIAVTRLSI